MRNCMILVNFLLISNFVFAHGEDQAGPHGGFVRMPGAFHTELIVDGVNKLKVYLLDIEWKNPSVLKSDLQVTHNNKNKASCEALQNYYVCTFTKNVNLLKKGELKVLAQREEQKGMEVFYKLPLKLQSSKSTPASAPASSHEGHH